MAADDKTIYELVTEHFSVDKDLDLLDVYIIQGHNYKAAIAPKAPNFINISRGTDVEKDSRPRERSKFGQYVAPCTLKFHVSIPEDEEILRKKAFDLLIPILIGHGVNFKFLKKGLKMSAESGQAGKDITIFANTRLDKKTEDWQKLITEITAVLVTNNIPPGYQVEGDVEKPEQKIQGCNYVTYRYERPKPVDPLKNMKIDVPNQKEASPYMALKECKK